MTPELELLHSQALSLSKHYRTLETKLLDILIEIEKKSRLSRLRLRQPFYLLCKLSQSHRRPELRLYGDCQKVRNYSGAKDRSGTK